MRILGIVGGISPESTIEYYKLLANEHPALVITSIDLNRLVGFMNAGDFTSVSDYLADEVQRLARAGAEVALIAANTPHIVFDDIQRRSPIPLVSIVEATRDEAVARALRRPALFGTRYTMQARFYQEVFASTGIALVVPNDDEQKVIHGIYFGELVKGILRPESKEALLSIVDAMHDRDGIDAVILGGTELPLILHDGDRAMPFLDTTRIHAAAALGRCRAT